MSEPPSPPRPVEEINYAMPHGPRRSGLLTAIGIASIVIACLSSLVNCGGIVSSAGMLAMRKIMNAPPSARASSAPATTAATTAPSGMTIKPFSFNVPRKAAILSIVASSLSLGVAVLLLVAGILMLRDSVRAFRLHWTYVTLKIPLVIVSAVATWLTYSAMMQSMYSSMGSSAPSLALRNWMVAVQVIVAAGISLAYPAALTIALSLSSTRSYYARLRESV